MNQVLRADADAIISASIEAVKPDEAVQRALQSFRPGKGRTLLVSTGKAAWQMAYAAVKCLGKVDGGVVVTKYDHVKGEIPGVICCEGGHPVPDEGSFSGTRKALKLVKNLTQEDTVLFLLSGGGSALFEDPLVDAEELQDITRQLLACGADIVEMNTIRKRLSGVKGGRFAQLCAPAKVFGIVLSDILGDPLDMIASGPAYPDSTTCEQALAIAKKYDLKLSDRAWQLLAQETPKRVDQRDHPDHRLRPGAVRGGGEEVRGNGLHPGAADRPAVLRSPARRQLPGLHRHDPQGYRQAHGIPGRRRNCCPFDGQRHGRTQSGAGALCRPRS